ncbi:hypothetical protein [Pseudomonas mucidolens]|uniref:Uncharacterized protein n=1 Tax=Pseudomonas mucidolens TaxID=46679 RepID=A0A1H2NGJ1_9PSED|nr:hypothetical protein [Pseudomonas mucidolens]SDV04607.1 hypothetical protein SAMN05216202_3699 [Pseudomonas mucidolens]SQH31962.1 Uncharacterised protein [Pseudomonas mucidolens]
MAFVIEPIINLFKKPDMTQVNKNTQENAELVREMKQSLEETNRAIKHSIASISESIKPFALTQPGLPGYSPEVRGNTVSAPTTTSLQSPAPWTLATTSRPPFPPIG